MSIAAVRRTFTRAKFQQHLDNQPPRKLAGTNQHACKCPLAVYLGKQSELPVAVTAENWVIGGKFKNLPKWAKAFVLTIDTRDHKSTTYGTAANLLRNL